MQIPIFNRNQGAVAAAKAEVERARFEVDRTKLALKARLATAYRAYQDAMATAERYRTRMIPKAQQAYDLYLTSFRGMAVAYRQQAPCPVRLPFRRLGHSSTVLTGGGGAFVSWIEEGGESNRVLARFVSAVGAASPQSQVAEGSTQSLGHVSRYVRVPDGLKSSFRFVR